MADESGIHSAVAVKLLFEWKDNQCLIDILPQQFHSALAPGPELRAHVVDHGNASLAHLARDTPIECWGVDYHHQVGPARVGLGNESVKQTPDFRQVAQNFGYAYHRQVLGLDDGVASRSPHAVSADAKELQRGVAVAHGFD